MSEAVWWEPPASAGGAGLQSREKASLLRQALAAGRAIPIQATPKPPKTQYCAVNVTGVIMPESGINDSNGIHAEGHRVRHPPAPEAGYFAVMPFQNPGNVSSAGIYAGLPNGQADVGANVNLQNAYSNCP